jgi:cell wall-associated NlpC family hydrolase
MISAKTIAPSHWTTAYVGLPWQDGGRGVDGVDCWGLVRIVYARELGIDLPSYGDTPASSLIAAARAITAGKDSEDWVKVASGLQRPFDVCVMRLCGNRVTGHVGVMIDQFNLLHVEAATDVAIVPITHFTVRERIACFRRHRHAKHI